MMLKERDKKLLFYSWSYGIFAACLIYVCLGCGAMAYTLQQSYTVANDMGLNGGTMDYVLGSDTLTSLNSGNITYWEVDISNIAGSASSGSDDLVIRKSTTNYANIHVTWTSSYVSAGHYNYYYTFAVTSKYGTIPSGSYIVDPGTYNWWESVNGGFITNYKESDNTECTGVNRVCIGTSSWAMAGDYRTYSGTALPDPPVINSVVVDYSCFTPGMYPVLESNVTGTVDDWGWSVYQNSTNDLVWDSDDSVETIVDHYLQPGYYDAQLTVSNAGGYDTEFKYKLINVTQPGTCNLTPYNPFPTQTTIVPTQAIFPTMTMPPHIVTNLTGINEAIDESIFGNMSQGYRDYFDYVGEQANTTFTGAVNTLFSPIALVINGIAQAISLFGDSLTVLTVYTTVPLAITGKVINAMPWQMITLITAGIAIDAILIIVLGR